MPDDIVIRNCSPVLASLKTGSIFTYRHKSRGELLDSLRRLNRLLSGKGVRAIPLRIGSESSIIYLYRAGRLRRDLSDGTARNILGAFGYGGQSAERDVVRLIGRIRESDSFPHEIGLFLGYPPSDVLGFIEGREDDCKLVGAWKVYSDEEAAKKKFSLYKKASELYLRRHAGGVSIEDLTVKSI